MEELKEALSILVGVLALLVGFGITASFAAIVCAAVGAVYKYFGIDRKSVV